MTYLKLSGVCVVSTLLMLGCVKKEEPKAEQNVPQEEVTVTQPEPETNTPEPEFTQLIELSPEPSEPEQTTQDTDETSSQDVATQPSTTIPAPSNSSQQSGDANSEDDAVAAVLKAVQPALQ